MYEPMGGSAPKYTGQNVINPIAAISAMAMLLDQFWTTCKWSEGIGSDQNWWTGTKNEKPKRWQDGIFNFRGWRPCL